MAAMSYSHLGDSVIFHNSMFLKKLSSQVFGRKKGWREKLGEFLESRPEQIAMFSLIVIDLLVICVQLFIIEPILKCETEEEQQHETPQESSYRVADHVLGHISTGILGILALEMVLLLIAFDLRFFKQPLYIIDGLVIVASLSVEFAENLPTTVVSGGSILVFFRLWRIVRIVHGVAMSVQEKNEEQIKKLEEEVHKLTGEKTHLATKFDYLKKRYKKLVDATKDELAVNGASTGQPIQNKKLLDDDDAMYMTPVSPSFLAPIPYQASPFKSPGAPHYIPPPPALHTIQINVAREEEEEEAEDEDMPIGSFAVSSPQGSTKDYRTF